jgi:hypothetical protein
MGKYVIKDEEEDAAGYAMAGMILFVICFVFVLSPGIIITSFLNLFINFTVGQLWGSSIIGTLGFIACLYFFSENGFSFKHFLIYAGIGAGIMILITLFIPDNLFSATIKEMFPIFFEELK